MKNFGGELGKRIKEEREGISINREDEREGWVVSGGSYDSPFMIFDKRGLNRLVHRESQDQLIGTEKVIGDEIRRRLLNKSSAAPVIAVDFGGTQGLSFMRIAKSLELEMGAISSRKLIIIVTNINPIEKIGVNGLSSEESVFFEENRELVTYIAATANELRRHVIETSNGSVPVRGNVDIIHESYAIQHSKIPDVVLPVLEDCLRDEDGVLLITSEGVLNNPHEEISDPVSIAQSNLVRSGKLQQQDLRDFGMSGYVILKRPDAPDIVV